MRIYRKEPKGRKKEFESIGISRAKTCFDKLTNLSQVKRISKKL
jgi:hypothetical protein